VSDDPVHALPGDAVAVADVLQPHAARTLLQDGLRPRLVD